MYMYVFWYLYTYILFLYSFCPIYIYIHKYVCIRIYICSFSLQLSPFSTCQKIYSLSKNSQWHSLQLARASCLLLSLCSLAPKTNHIKSEKWHLSQLQLPRMPVLSPAFFAKKLKIPPKNKSGIFLRCSFSVRLLLSVQWKLTGLPDTDPSHRYSHCNALQHTATLCNTMQRSATHYNALQHTATLCNTLQRSATHCNALQHTATLCNILQRSATHCNALQHTATLCNTLQHTATLCNTLQRNALEHTATLCNTLQRSATLCTTLHHTAPHCNTLQHTLSCTHCT